MSAFVRAFPLWITLGSLLALLEPRLFTWFLPHIAPGLAVIMLGMGVTLTFEDFARVASHPVPVVIGVALQYVLMPTPYAVGLILVACCPGGTASNVIAYIAKADVALSVSMTAVSTLLAAAMTPLMASFLIGNTVPVDAVPMLVTTAKVVFVPVLAGLIIRRFAKGVAERILPVAPVAAVIAIVLIVGAILGDKRGALLEAGLPLLLAVFTTHALGFAIAFLLAGVLTREVDRFGVVAHTVSIEVGMQNSGLVSVLAQSHFANPLTAVPSAISAVFHCILGSALAAYWSRHPSADQARADQTS